MEKKRKSNGVHGGLFLFFLLIIPIPCSAAPSVEIQENIDSLVRTNRCVDCDLSGAELNRLNLSGADLRGADLSNATFFLADLSDADLRGAILRGTQFGGADLANADLRQADLRGVKIAGAYLVGARVDGTFSDVSVTDDESFQDVVEKTYIPDDTVSKKTPEKQNVTIGDRRDFGPVPPQIDQANIASIDKQGNGPVRKDAPPIKKVSPVEELVVQYEPVALAAELPAEIDRLKTPGAEQKKGAQPEEGRQEKDGDEIKAEGAREPAVEAPVSEVEAPVSEETTIISDRGEKIESRQGQESPDSPVAEDAGESAESNDLKMNEDQPVQVSGSLEETEKEVLSEQLALQKQVIKSRKCYACNLAGSDFSGKNLDSADLEGSDFTGANLENTDFEDANLKGVSFRNARLNNAKFNGADLYKADFRGADLTGAEFKKALIDEANFQDATGYGGLMLTQPQ